MSNEVSKAIQELQGLNRPYNSSKLDFPRVLTRLSRAILRLSDGVL